MTFDFFMFLDFGGGSGNLASSSESHESNQRKVFTEVGDGSPHQINHNQLTWESIHTADRGVQ